MLRQNKHPGWLAQVHYNHLNLERTPHLTGQSKPILTLGAASSSAEQITGQDVSTLSPASQASRPFPHTSSQLRYNSHRHGVPLLANITTRVLEPACTDLPYRELATVIDACARPYPLQVFCHPHRQNRRNHEGSF